MATSLTSRIVDIPAWPLPASVEIRGERVRWSFVGLPREVDPYVADRGAIDTLRANLAQTRRTMTMLALRQASILAGEMPRAQRRSQATTILENLVVLVGRRAAILDELAVVRRRVRESRGVLSDAFRERNASTKRRGPAVDPLRRLRARDESCVRAVAAAVDAKDAQGFLAAVTTLFRESGPLAPPEYWTEREVPLAFVGALARLFVDAQDLLDALDRSHVDRAMCIRGARALESCASTPLVGTPLARAAARMSHGLILARDWARVGRVLKPEEHARAVVERAATVWMRVFLTPTRATWHADGGLAIAPQYTGLGPALAVSLLEQSGGSGTGRFTCEGCRRRFDYGTARRARAQAPVFCPSCRKRGESRRPSSDREAIVQILQTRIAWGWDEERMRSYVAARLGPRDTFAALLARARRRSKRR